MRNSRNSSFDDATIRSLNGKSVDDPRWKAPAKRIGPRRILSPASVLLFTLCCAYVTYVHTTARVLPYDDSFITFRYVSNLFNGNGLVYNPGERVFGSTTPLYVVWLVLLKALAPFVEIPALAVRGNVVFYIAAGAGMLFLVRSLLGSTAAGAIAATLFLMRFDMLETSTSGNETFLFGSLVLWSFFFLMRRKYLLSGLLAGLSIMARPEGVFCAFLCGLVWLLHDRKRPVPLAACIVVPGIIWTCFAFAYYGTPVYHSLVAKSQPLYPLPPGYAFHRMAQRLAFWTVGRSDGIYAMWIIVAAGLAGFILRKRAHPQTWFVVPSFAILILLFYAVSNPFLHHWYFLAVLLGWFLLVFVGLKYLFDVADDAVRARYDSNKVSFLLRFLSFAAPVVLLTGSAVFTWEAREIDNLPGCVHADAVELRVLTYKKAAEFINRAGKPDDTIAAPEVGSLGYYSRNHIYDACGLVTPEAVPFLPAPYGKRVGPNVGSISAGFAKAVYADWIVTIEIFAVESLMDDPWFNDNYVLVRKFPLQFTTFGCENVLVFHRK